MNLDEVGEGIEEARIAEFGQEMPDGVSVRGKSVEL